MSEIAHIIIWHGKRHDGDLTILQVEEHRLLLTLIFFGGDFQASYPFEDPLTRDKVEAILHDFDVRYLQSTIKARDQLIAEREECLH